MPLFRKKSKDVYKSESSTTTTNSSDEPDDERRKDFKDYYNADYALEIREITLQLGNVTANFMPDGSWRPRPSEKNSTTLKLLKLKIKNEKLTKESEKLKTKFDALVDMAKTTSAEHMEVKQELDSLRNILKKAPIFKNISRRS